MTNFRNLVFAKHCTNTFGRYVPGDRAQARFPRALINTYVKLGILIESSVPVALKAPKRYAPKKKV